MKNKNCIICNNNKFILAFPFGTYYNRKKFKYYKCKCCNFVVIDPYPNKFDFKKLYNNKTYHEKYYSNLESSEYKKSAEYLSNYLVGKKKILDFGCGSGHFIKQIKNKHLCYGAEYEMDTVKKCREKIKNVFFFQSDEINKKKFDYYFDVIHLGDVLEHVTNPSYLLKKLQKKIKKNGILYLDGPIERNFSLVNLSIILFGNIKKFLIPKFKNNFEPYHLYFCNFKNQLLMFKKIKNCKIVKYEIYETGWPYNNGGIIKKVIVILAKLFSQLNIFGFKIGNRARIIVKKND